MLRQFYDYKLRSKSTVICVQKCNAWRINAKIVNLQLEGRGILCRHAHSFDTKLYVSNCILTNKPPLPPCTTTTTITIPATSSSFSSSSSSSFCSSSFSYFWELTVRGSTGITETPKMVFRSSRTVYIHDPAYDSSILSRISCPKALVQNYIKS